MNVDRSEVMMKGGEEEYVRKASVNTRQLEHVTWDQMNQSQIERNISK